MTGRAACTFAATKRSGSSQSLRDWIISFFAVRFSEVHAVATREGNRWLWTLACHGFENWSHCDCGAGNSCPPRVGSGRCVRNAGVGEACSGLVAGENGARRELPVVRMVNVGGLALSSQSGQNQQPYPSMVATNSHGISFKYTLATDLSQIVKPLKYR